MPNLNITPKDYAAGFPAVIGSNAKILILGTLPGVASLAQQQYYAHPQNAFWKIIEALFEIPTQAPYLERCERIKTMNLAIWDVCHSAYRPGSLDSAISTETITANDIAGLLLSHPSIALIAFNGNTAANLFKKHIKHESLPQTVTLPSTSPAYASMRFKEKLERWRILQTKLSQASHEHDFSLPR